MNILSVDWDFFFPDVMKYDWGMNEDRFLYYEWIWHLRWSNKALLEREIKAKEDIWPRSSFLKFFDKILPGFYTTLAITDSHLDIKKVVEAINDETEFLYIWNFDQHHDCGYGEWEKETCGNWAYLLKDDTAKYTQIYPDWRKEIPEKEIPDWIDVKYESDFDMDSIQPLDLIFICRSSPWTPSWSDRLWLRFINRFKKEGRLWRSKIAVDYALKERKFDWNQAIQQEKKMEEVMKKAEQKFKNGG